ncbi:MAG: helicase HerA domain-containing protein [Candidatus Methanosuratincola sp.]|nr:hypothetical protein [Candidatus Methanosuratincola sp.]
MKGISYAAIRGKKTLIRGDVGKGKTRLLSRLLSEAAESEGAGSITVIDMAPGERSVGERKVGGQLVIPALPVARYIAPERVVAPRLEGATAEEVVRLAMRNASALEPCLAQYIASPTPVLFVNDLTIYLQCGKAELLGEAITLAKTFVGAAYWGDFFDDKGSGINEKERLLLGKLIGLFDIVVDL